MAGDVLIDSGGHLTWDDASFLVPDDVSQNTESDSLVRVDVDVTGTHVNGLSDNLIDLEASEQCLVLVVRVESQILLWFDVVDDGSQGVYSFFPVVSSKVVVIVIVL